MMDAGYGNDSRDSRLLKQVRKSYSRLGLAYLLFFLVAGVSQAAVTLLLEGWKDAMGQSLYTMFGLLAMYPVAFPLCWLLLRTLPKRGPSWQFSMGGGRFAAVLVISLGSMLVGNLIGQVLMLIVNVLTGQSMLNAVQELIMEMEPWSVLVAAVLVAPVIEEMLFRKLLIDRVACYGQLTAVLMSGGLFAIAHGNLYQFFYAFALGVIFAYVYLRTGRIRYTIALHMTVNFCGSIIPLLLLRYMETNAMTATALVLAWYVVLGSCVIGAVVLLVLGRKQIWFYRMPRRVPAGAWFMAVCVNVGVILFLIYNVISFLLL